jgi:two-component system CAI-1 autoinducer sensor kinase/phosphatase CqsS
MDHNQRAATLDLQWGETRPQLLQWAEELAFQEPIEPVPNGCAKRARIVGVCTLLGHPLFYFLWTASAPQPYESGWLRLAMCVCGVALVALPTLQGTRLQRWSPWLYSLLLWVTLPLFFSWMLLFNAASTVSLVGLGAMFLIYYQLTDWRLASAGTAAALLAVRLIAPAAGWPGMDVPLDQWISDLAMLAFCWIAACFLGCCAMRTRRAHANSAMSAVGMFAHELRTPLATLHLIAHAVRELEPESERARDRLSGISERLERTVRRMNSQIDLQISTARLRTTPTARERIAAAALVNGVLAAYPFQADEASWVAVHVREDFEFEGSPPLFAQVIENMLKNSLRALRTAAGRDARELSIVVDADRNGGTLTFRDNGIGMTPGLASRIFEPFVSTQAGSTHGLGLTFCAQTVRGAGGDVRVEARPGQGTEFTINLPRV